MDNRQRNNYARQVEKVGQQVNGLRLEFNSEGAPFSAGLLRAAEEALLIVMTALDNAADVPAEEL